MGCNHSFETCRDSTNPLRSATGVRSEESAEKILLRLSRRDGRPDNTVRNSKPEHLPRWTGDRGTHRSHHLLSGASPPPSARTASCTYRSVLLLRRCSTQAARRGGHASGAVSTDCRGQRKDGEDRAVYGGDVKGAVGGCERGARAVRGVAGAVEGVVSADTLTIRRCSRFVMMVRASTSSQLQRAHYTAKESNPLILNPLSPLPFYTP